MDFEKIIQNLSSKCFLNDEEVTEIVSYLKVKKLKRKSFWVKQNEINRNLAFINKGLFKVYMTDMDGVDHIIQLSKEDNWVGDVRSSDSGEPSLTNIECIEEAEVLYFEHYDLEKLYSKFHKMETIFRKMLLKRMVALQKDRYNLISLSAEERYLGFINNYPDFATRISQKDIASYLGIFPESLSRIRRNLSNK